MNFSSNDCKCREGFKYLLGATIGALAIFIIGVIIGSYQRPQRAIREPVPVIILNRPLDASFGFEPGRKFHMQISHDAYGRIVP